MRAAANYRNPVAQYEMGNMFLRGEGGVKASIRQAGRWFQLAAAKGHAGAQATLGNLLFQSGKVVRGLAMMTAALERANPIDRTWIRSMQEEAFSLADDRIAARRSRWRKTSSPRVTTAMPARLRATASVPRPLPRAETGTGPGSKSGLFGRRRPAVIRRQAVIMHAGMILDGAYRCGNP